MSELKIASILWKPDSNDGHFYVVITPTSYPEVLIVNFTEDRPIADQSCKLKVGEHTCITKNSVIAYDRAMLYNTAELNQLLIQGLIELKGLADVKLMQKIWKGAFATNRMRNREYEFLRDVIPSEFD